MEGGRRIRRGRVGPIRAAPCPAPAGSSPHGPGCFDHRAQLASLIVQRNAVADDRCGKPALGAQGQPLQRQVLGGLMDAVGELFHRLPAGAFGRHKTEDDRLVVGNVLQGRKGARALVVVFQEQALGADVLKDGPGDGLVAALGQPPAALIAASEMKAERDFRKSGHEGVVHLDSAQKPLLCAPALGLVKGARLGVE